MIARLGLLSFALAAACSAEPAPAPEPEPPLPSIPAALHGCWELHQTADEEFPDGLSEVLTVTADRIVTESAGVGRRVGTVELVERLTPTLIEGRISGLEGGNLITLATALELDPEGAPPGTLLLREGDAGSYQFARCDEATAAAQRYSLVIATSGRQDDPRPAPCGPDGNCGDFFYRSEFRGARVIAGAELPPAFTARLKLHTPYISNYVLALIVERREDGTLLVRRQAGFNGRTGVACFNEPSEWPVAWQPEVPMVRWDRGDLCLADEGQIDPNAPGK